MWSKSNKNKENKKNTFFFRKISKMSKKDPVKEFFAGGFGGSCLVLVGHPLDTIKV